MIKLSGFLLLLTMNMTWASTPQFSKPIPTLLSSLRCEQKVQETLKLWNSDNDWSKHLSSTSDNGVILRSPTKSFATWVGVDITENEAVLELIKPLNSQKVTFDTNCQPTTHVLTAQPSFSFKGRFTDVDLKKFMQENPKGILYTWSPNMPWSVEGIKEIKKASIELKVPVLILLASGTDHKMVQELLKKKVVSPEDTKEHASLEFVMRGMTVHDPSVIWFKDEKLTRWARPGYEVSGLFVNYLSKELK